MKSTSAENSIKTLHLDGKNEQDIQKAAAILKSGGLVAIPTETVYGLAANAMASQHAASIFTAKGRPSDNPLIAHIESTDRLTKLWSEVPPLALTLAQHFWPGPLTMVYKKHADVPDIITAGLDTVAVRMPDHACALSLISACDFPLAAPSANSSGRPSPTTAQHVLDDLSGKISAVLDGGNCTLGVESTVVDLTQDVPTVLRPGAITEGMIRAVCGAARYDDATFRPLSDAEQPRSPGMKYRHYAPKAPMTLFVGPPAQTAIAINGALANTAQNCAVICFDEYMQDFSRHKCQIYSLGQSFDSPAHAERLFSILRQIDDSSADIIFTQSPGSLGTNAATFNRLLKACAFDIKDCTNGRAIIGVTGRSGSGKSLFSQIATDMGAQAIDADAVYKQLLNDSEPMNKAICTAFPDFSYPIDRAALAKVIFSSEQARKQLNAATHPFVIAEMQNIMKKSTADILVLDVPLLFESELNLLCDVTVGITAPKSLSYERILQRDGITAQAAEARLSAQPKDDFYHKRCDFIIENSGTKTGFEREIKLILAHVKKYILGQPAL